MHPTAAGFEWFDAEISAVRTPRFHQVHCTKAVTGIVCPWNLSVDLPATYRVFSSKYGYVRLFRRRRDQYLLELYPYLAKVDLCEYWPELVAFGTYENSDVFFRLPKGDAPMVDAVFESGNVRPRATGQTFDVWLNRRMARLQSGYTRKEWECILRGPPPFSSEELSRIAARELFSVEIVGEAPDKKLLFRVRNGSDRTLPFITVGIETDCFVGAVGLRVGDIPPGGERVVAHLAYRDVYPAPKYQRICAVEAPGPESRDDFWEFRSS